ncbi:MAG: hypothetical protein CVT95_00330 [Bacteroidetes bacterium HGW-Bacteroidetes-12]|nr:MAG: hypothetical protein CVT95_00330 [Bacteroidetes bacterium HGW-Bacteroidetes-12]
MTISQKLLGLFLATSLVTAFSSCDKDFDSPPIKTIPEGSIITIADLRAMYQGVNIKITDDLSLFAVVTADEQSGNLFKEGYIQDATGAINLRLAASGGLYIGDSVRVYLKGTVLSRFSQMMQLDSVNVDNNIIKQATKKERQPELFSSIVQITTNTQAKLIRLNNVQFVSAELGNTYADGVNLQSQNRMLEDSLGNKIIVRTSGFANFANDTIPSGRGSIVAVVSQFNSDLQLLIRNPSEVNFTLPRFGGTTPPPPGNSITKNFTDQSITSGGWTTKQVIGTFNWTTSDQGSAGNFYAKMSNFASGNTPSEAWLISPAINLSTSTNSTLDFRNAFNFTGAPLQVMVSTNYDGTSAPSTATWTQLGVNLSSGGFAWVNGGPVSLNAFLGNSAVYVAYKYTGSATNGSTWEVDDIVIAW